MSTAPKKRDAAREGKSCCDWLTFRQGFEEHWPRWINTPATTEHWKAAVSDWRAGNTGFEAAHNAQRREKERDLMANQQPLVHLGGRNYAFAGSELARQFGRRKHP